jgi:RecA/RadA recombinase
VRNGVDKVLRFWPLVLFVLAMVAVAAEIRMAVAENEKDIAEVRAQQQRIEDAIKKQAEVNGRIDERTVSIQNQLNLIITELRK